MNDKLTTEDRIQNVMRIIFAVLVLPMLLTAAFSKIVMTKNVFSVSYSFSVENPFGQEIQKQMNLDCGKENCGFNDPAFPNIHVYKNHAQLATFSASQEGQQVLETLRSQVDSKFNEYLDFALCEKDPVDFSARLVIRKITQQFIPDAIATGLFATLELNKLGKEASLKENSKPLCESLVSPLRRYFISEISPTYQHEMKKLKIVTAFYLFVAFLGFFGFYLYPHYKRRTK